MTPGRVEGQRKRRRGDRGGASSLRAVGTREGRSAAVTETDAGARPVVDALAVGGGNDDGRSTRARGCCERPARAPWRPGTSRWAGAWRAPRRGWDGNGLRAGGTPRAGPLEGSGAAARASAPVALAGATCRAPHAAASGGGARATCARAASAPGPAGGRPAASVRHASGGLTRGAPGRRLHPARPRAGSRSAPAPCTRREARWARPGPATRARRPPRRVPGAGARARG